MIVVVIPAVHEAVVMVKTSPGWPVLFVAEAKVPLANDVSRVVSFLEFFWQCGEAGVQTVGNSRMNNIVKTSVYWVPKKYKRVFQKLKMLFEQERFVILIGKGEKI